MTSFAGGKAKFDPEEMTVKETEFVRDTFQIEPDVYCQIKSKVWDELSAKAKEEGAKAAKEEAKRTAKEELKAELTKELMPELAAAADKKALASAVKKAREELEPEVRAAAIKEVQEGWKKELLTDGDRQAFATALRDIEVESLTFATSASREADQSAVHTAWNRRIKRTLFALSIAGAGPFTMWLLATRDVHSPTFWLLAFPYLVAVVYCATMAAKTLPPPKPEYGERKPAQVDVLRKLSSDYLMLVSKARLVRHLHLNTKIRRDVQAEFDDLANRKAALDDKYQPSLDLVEEVKPQVRIRLEAEVDPEKIYAEEFEEQIKEQAEGKQAG